MPARGLLAVWLAGLALSLPGCGRRPPPSAPVSGTVTLRGKPLPADATAFISFAPASTGAAAVSAPITRGAYECPHAPQGQVTAFFEITRPAGPPRKSDRTGEMYQETQSLVPARYAGGLPLTLDGPSTRDFDLVD